jgi:hypothetical protein
MILLFACIIAGIIIGIGGTVLFYFWQEWEDDEPVPDLSEIMRDIQPDGTPFLSEIERHRAKHLAAMEGNHDGTGLHRGGS